jgi:RNA recognition motif-containing protein
LHGFRNPQHAAGSHPSERSLKPIRQELCAVLAHRGRTITLPSEVLGGDKSIFVKHLDRNIDNQALYDTFSLLGNIFSCKVAGDLAGKSRGYGFVHYETKEAATQAIERVNGLQIGEKIVEVQPFKGAMVRKTASSGCNFVH